MKILLRRLLDTGESTIGMLYINNVFKCFTLEDTHRDIKIYGETRIQAGTYKILLRAAGGKHQIYRKKFPGHQGMLHLQDVPGFTYIYLHIGNKAKDTLGCILVGQDLGKNYIGGSAKAYLEIYPIIKSAILCGEDVRITIEDEVKK